MAKLKPKEILNKIQDGLKIAIDIGFSFIMVLIIIDILFPNNIYVTENLSGIVESISSKGAVGLFALLIFVLIYKKQ